MPITTHASIGLSMVASFSLDHLIRPQED
jgi:hypothetical protein